MNAMIHRMLLRSFTRAVALGHRHHGVGAGVAGGSRGLLTESYCKGPTEVSYPARLHIPKFQCN